MLIISATSLSDTTADKYDAIEKIALNLEQAIAIADAARPQRQFLPSTPPISSNPTVSSTPKRTPQASMGSESNWRSPTPNRSATPSSICVPDRIPYISDPIPYSLSETEYLRLREVKACFYCKKEHVDLSHNYKSCPKRLAKLEKIKQKEANLADESTIETDLYQYETSNSYSLSITMLCHNLGEKKINERDGFRKVLPPKNPSEVSRPQVSKEPLESNVVDKDTQRSQLSSSVPLITISASLDNHAVRGPVDTGASSNFISLQVVQRAKLHMCPIAPSLLHHALPKTPTPIFKQVTASVKLTDSDEIKVKNPSTFKVAPLASHEVIFGMPFLADNNLLIDPVARKLLPRLCDLSNYVKVGNALMELPAPEAQLEEVNSLVEEPPKYASLNDSLERNFPMSLP